MFTGSSGGSSQEGTLSPALAERGPPCLSQTYWQHLLGSPWVARRSSDVEWPREEHWRGACPHPWTLRPEHQPWTGPHLWGVGGGGWVWQGWYPLGTKAYSLFNNQMNFPSPARPSVQVSEAVFFHPRAV